MFSHFPQINNNKQSKNKKRKKKWFTLQNYKYQVLLVDSQHKLNSCHFQPLRYINCLSPNNSPWFPPVLEKEPTCCQLYCNLHNDKPFFHLCNSVTIPCLTANTDWFYPPLLLRPAFPIILWSCCASANRFYFQRNLLSPWKILTCQSFKFTSWEERGIFIAL